MSAYPFPAPPVVPPVGVGHVGVGPPAAVVVNGFAFGLPGPTLVGSAAQPPMKNQQPPMKNQQTQPQPQPQQRQGQRVTPDASLIAARLPPAATLPTPPNVHVDNQQNIQQPPPPQKDVQLRYEPKQPSRATTQPWALPDANAVNAEAPQAVHKPKFRRPPPTPSGPRADISTVDATLVAGTPHERALAGDAVGVQQALNQRISEVDRRDARTGRSALARLANESDWHGQTPLHAACKGGSDECVRYLLHLGANPAAADRLGATPVHVASCLSEDTCLSALLAATGNGFHVLPSPARRCNVRDSCGRTPLHYAAASCSDACHAMLLRRGADPDARDNAGAPPHDAAPSASARRGCIERNGRRGEPENPNAVPHRPSAVVVANAANDPTEQPNQNNVGGKSSVRAQLANNAASMHSALQEARGIIGADDRHRFISSSNVRRKEEMVARLCQRTTLSSTEEQRRLRAAEMAADGFARNKEKDRKPTAPYEQILYGDMHAHAQVFLARDAHPARAAAASAPPDARDGERVLSLCRRGDEEGVFSLLEQARKDRNARDDARNAKHVAWIEAAWQPGDDRRAAATGALDAATPVRALVDFQDARGRTPAMEALAGGHTSLARRLLVDMGANAALRDDMGRNCLHFCALAGAAEIVDTLLEDSRYNAPIAPRVFAKSQAPTMPRVWEVRDSAGKRPSDLAAEAGIRAALRRKMAEAGGGVAMSASRLVKLGVRRGRSYQTELKALRQSPVCGGAQSLHRAPAMRGPMYAHPADASFAGAIDDIAARVLREVLLISLDAQRGRAPPFRATSAAVVHHDLNLRVATEARLPQGAGGEAPGMIRDHAADTAPCRDPEQQAPASVKSNLESLHAVLPMSVGLRMREAWTDLRRRQRRGERFSIGEAIGMCSLVSDLVSCLTEDDDAL